MSTLHKQLTELLNYHNQESESNTPDYILAEYMLDTLNAYNKAIRDTKDWHQSSHVQPEINNVNI